MDIASFEKIRTLGENICIEFKQGRNGFEDDAFQTVCSFLNRFGGDIFLGVSDDEFFYKAESENSKNNLIETTQASQKITQAPQKITQANAKNDNTTQGNSKQANSHKNDTTQTGDLSEEDVAILSIIKQFPQSSLKKCKFLKLY